MKVGGALVMSGVPYLQNLIKLHKLVEDILWPARETVLM